MAEVTTPMTQIKFWETQLFNKDWEQPSLKDVEQIIDFTTTINQCQNFNPEQSNTLGNYPFTLYEEAARTKNLNIFYTDYNHPMLLYKPLNILLINPTFFNMNKKEFLDIYYRKKIKINSTYLYIPEEFFSNEKLKEILKNDNNLTTIKLGVNSNIVDPEIIDILHEKSITCYALDKQIYNRYILGNYTKQLLEKCDPLIINNIEDHELPNLKYIKPGTKIIITDKKDAHTNVELYTKLINGLENEKVNATVEIDEHHLSNKMLKDSKIPYQNYNFINLKIERDGHIYTQEEYLKEDKQLDALIEDIKNSDLSPFEQYIATFNIVKQFKPYKENHENYINHLVENGMDLESATEYAYDLKNEEEIQKWEKENNFNDAYKSRRLRYILNNDYMVCVGYASLLEDLLDRLNIESAGLNVYVDTSYNNGFTEENIPVSYSGHRRALVHLVDPKYNIDGYYVADPTWDNDLEKDFYSHAVMTIDETTKERDMQQINDLDYIFNVRTMSEFNLKINKLLDKKVIKKEKEKFELEKKWKKEDSFFNSNPSFKEIINKYTQNEKEVLNEFLQNLLNIFRNFDYNAYSIFYKKYTNIQKIIDTNFERQETKQAYYDLLTELANYIISKNNKTIDGDQILLAAATVKLMHEDYTEEELNNYIENQLRSDQISRQTIAFPRREIYSSDLDEITVINDENKFEIKNGKTR